MIAEELINQMIPALKVTDPAEKAIIWMEEFKIDQLPVVENKEFKGLITEDMILESNDLNRPVGEFRLVSGNCYVKAWQHYFDILKIAHAQQAQIVAVINELDEFMGITTYQDVLNEFAKSFAIQSPGGIILLSIKQRDFLLSEVSRIIESNGVKILGTYVQLPYADSDKLFLTIKLNVNDLNQTVASLERFEYNVIAKYNDIDRTETSQERLDHLFRYLNI